MTEPTITITVPLNLDGLRDLEKLCDTFAITFGVEKRERVASPELKLEVTPFTSEAATTSEFKVTPMSGAGTGTAETPKKEVKKRKRRTRAELAAAKAIEEKSKEGKGTGTKWTAKLMQTPDAELVAKPRVVEPTPEVVPPPVEKPAIEALDDLLDLPDEKPLDIEMDFIPAVQNFVRTYDSKMKRQGAGKEYVKALLDRYGASNQLRKVPPEKFREFLGHLNV